MELSKNAKIGIGAGIGLALIILIIIATKKKGPAKDDTSDKSGSTAKSDGGGTGGGKGNQAAQDINALSGAAGAVIGAATGGGSSTTTTSVSTTSLPPVGPGVVQIDMTGSWWSTQNSAYTPQCDSGHISLGNNNALDAAYETTGAGTITFMNNPTLIANSPSGAITGTIGGAGTNSDGSTNIGTTVTWNDVNGDTWTRVI